MCQLHNSVSVAYVKKGEWLQFRIREMLQKNLKAQHH